MAAYGPALVASGSHGRLCDPRTSLLLPQVEYPDSVSSGTTIIAVKYNGGVVLGADTRTSAGSFIVNRAARKLTKITDYIYVCRSGSAADTQTLTQIAKVLTQQYSLELADGEFPRVNTVATLFRKYCYMYKHVLSAGLIVAGWDARKGPQIYSIPLGGTKLELPYASGGSGSIFVSGYMDANYRPDMTQDECRSFVKLCVSHAIARDGASGGLVRIVDISKQGVQEEYVGADDLPFK